MWSSNFCVSPKKTAFEPDRNQYAKNVPALGAGGDFTHVFTMIHVANFSKIFDTWYYLIATGIQKLVVIWYYYIFINLCWPIDLPLFFRLHIYIPFGRDDTSIYFKELSFFLLKVPSILMISISL